MFFQSLKISRYSALGITMLAIGQIAHAQEVKQLSLNGLSVLIGAAGKAAATGAGDALYGKAAFKAFDDTNYQLTLVEETNSKDPLGSTYKIKLEKKINFNCIAQFGAPCPEYYAVLNVSKSVVSYKRTAKGALVATTPVEKFTAVFKKEERKPLCPTKPQCSISEQAEPAGFGSCQVAARWVDVTTETDKNGCVIACTSKFVCDNPCYLGGNEDGERAFAEQRRCSILNYESLPECEPGTTLVDPYTKFNTLSNPQNQSEQCIQSCETGPFCVSNDGRK